MLGRRDVRGQARARRFEARQCITTTIGVAFHLLVESSIQIAEAQLSFCYPDQPLRAFLQKRLSDWEIMRCECQ